VGRPVVLWISRHLPLPSQIRELDRILGDYELKIHNTDECPLPTAQHAAELAVRQKADIVVPVLPLSFVIHLIEEARKRGFTVVKAHMQTLHNCETQPCLEYDPDKDTIVVSKDKATGEKIYRHFRFVEFRIVDDIIVRWRPFTRRNLRRIRLATATKQDI